MKRIIVSCMLTVSIMTPIITYAQTNNQALIQQLLQQLMQLQQILVQLLVEQQVSINNDTGVVTTTTSSPQVTLTVNPTTITSDGKPGTATLSWSSTNAEYCNFEKTKLATSGSMSVLVAQTGTYNISCTGPGGSATSNPVVVTFKPTDQLPNVDLKINGFDGPITKGADYSIFTWSSSNTDYCTASGDTNWSGAKPTSGSERVWTGNEKTGVTTYKLTCGVSSGKLRSVTDSIEVKFRQ